MRAFSQHLAGITYNPNLAIRTMCLTCLAASRANKTEKKQCLELVSLSKDFNMKNAILK